MNIEWRTKWLRELGYVVRARPSEVAPHVVDVEAYVAFDFKEVDQPCWFQKRGAISSPDPVASIDDAERFLNGSVKWDGCSNFSFDAGERTQPVKLKAPNAFGLYDMLGNVYDWCEDWLGPYDAAASVDPRGPATGSSRVVRGGSRVSPAMGVRAARRSMLAPGDACVYVGFRLARDR